jgi:hypothetical protein
MTVLEIRDVDHGPFGNADGHRANIASDAFVQVVAGVTPTGLTSRPEDRTARVVVGKKGAGKTVYLRRFQLAANEESSVYTTRVDPRPPDTDAVVQFCQWYRDEDLTERWSMVWRAAILRAVCTHALYDEDLEEYAHGAVRRGLERSAAELMPGVTTPRSVHDQLQGLIYGHDSSRHLEKTLRLPEWGNLEHWVGEFLQEAPPIFFYLDAIDEEYVQAPSFWLRCQKGLFFQVMRLLRDPVLGSRLHVVIAIRENVFASVLRSEHATRYRTDPHIRLLAWDRPAIGFFLREKLARLNPELAMKGGPSSRSTPEWLGRTTVFNEARGIDEDVEDYLIRHTRLLPRDIVLLGNALSAEVARAKARGETSVSEPAIRRVVGDVARWCGDEQLAICAGQIAADLIPAHAHRKEKVETFVGSSEYRRDMKDRIGAVVRKMHCDQFGAEELDRMAELGREALDETIDLPTVLWQNGLLGFRDPRLEADEWIFHGVEDVDRFHVPLDREAYAFHPCLLDALGFSSAGAGSQPVKPWRRARS